MIVPSRNEHPPASEAAPALADTTVALALAAGLGIAVRDFPDDVAAAHADAMRTLAALPAPPDSATSGNQ